MTKPWALLIRLWSACFYNWRTSHGLGGQKGFGVIQFFWFIWIPTHCIPVWVSPALFQRDVTPHPPSEMKHPVENGERRTGRSWRQGKESHFQKPEDLCPPWFPENRIMGLPGWCLTQPGSQRGWVGGGFWACPLEAVSRDFSNFSVCESANSTHLLVWAPSQRGVLACVDKKIFWHVEG